MGEDGIRGLVCEQFVQIFCGTRRNGEGGGRRRETLKLARAVQSSMVTGTVNKTDLT